MAYKKKFKKQAPALTEARRKTEKPSQHRATKKKKPSNVRWMVPVMLAITFVAFIPVLRAGFVSWDDGEYVLQNTFLKNSDLKSLLTTAMQGNVHPLTMFSLFINYLVSGENAWS